jgi:hypothetical protein
MSFTGSCGSVMTAWHQPDCAVPGAFSGQPQFVSVVGAQHRQVEHGGDPSPGRGARWYRFERFHHPRARAGLGIGQSDRRHRGAIPGAGRHAPLIQLLHQASPARDAEPDPPQPRHAVRWRRTVRSLEFLRATDRRRVSHFQPCPLHQPHGRGRAPFPPVMSSMIRASDVASRRRDSAVSGVDVSPASHQRRGGRLALPAGVSQRNGGGR